MKKNKKHSEAKVEDEGPAAVLLLAGLGVGIWAWLRARKTQAVITSRQFMPRNLSPSPVRKPQGNQVSQQWEPWLSPHWRG